MDTLPKRNEMNPKDMWHLQDIYKDISAWEKDFSFAENAVNSFTSFMGKLGTSAQMLLDCLKKSNDTSLIIEQLYVYAFMGFHQDSTNTLYQGLSSRAETLIIQYSSATAFIVPEILSIPENTLSHFIKENASSFAVYTHFLENILRQKNHTLSSEQEALLAAAGA